MNINDDFDERLLMLGTDSYAAWKEFAMSVEKRMRDGEEFQYLRDWAGKLPGAVARIAGLFHLASQVKEDEGIISAETMTNAIKVGEALSQHAIAAFDLVGEDPELSGARKVWKYLVREQKRYFTARDAFRALQAQFRRMDKLMPALNILEERGYIARPDDEAAVGRPSMKYVVCHPDAIDWDGIH